VIITRIMGLWATCYQPQLERVVKAMLV